MSDPRERIIKIKTGVVKRLAKEKTVYEKEASLQRERVQKYKDDGKDAYDVRKQEEVLQESLMMIPDCQRRLDKAYKELKNVLESEAELKENEVYIEAEKILKDSEAHLSKQEESPQMC